MTAATDGYAVAVVVVIRGGHCSRTRAGVQSVGSIKITVISLWFGDLARNELSSFGHWDLASVLSGIPRPVGVRALAGYFCF
jgi:hypothetical protein